MKTALVPRQRVDFRLNMITLTRLRKYVARKRATKAGARTTMTNVVERALDEYFGRRHNAVLKFIQGVGRTL